MEAPLLRGRHHGSVHRLRRLRDRLPARRPRLRRHERRLQAAPDRDRLRRPGRLQPRRQGLHVVHPRLPPFPGVGARDRRVHVRPLPGDRRAERRVQGHLPRPGRRPRAARGRPGRRARLRHARLRARARHHRRRARLLPRRRRLHVEGDSRHRAHARRHRRVGRQPLHVLREHAGVHGSREGRRAHRARRHVVPVVDPAGDEATQGGQGRAAARA